MNRIIFCETIGLFNADLIKIILFLFQIDMMIFIFCS
jgi:hypothetical protein